MPLFLREHWNGLYRTDVYFITRNLIELPIFVISSFGFILIAYYMVGLRYVECTHTRTTPQHTTPHAYKKERYSNMGCFLPSTDPILRISSSPASSSSSWPTSQCPTVNMSLFLSSPSIARSSFSHRHIRTSL